MALIIADRVKETTVTTGTGHVTLTGAFGGFQSFSDAIGDGNKTYYVIENGSDFEIGIGTYTLASNSLSRDTVLQSSNEDGNIDLDGVSIVFCSYPADRTVVRNDANELAVSQPMIVSSTTDLGSSVGVSGLLTMRRTSAGNFFHAYVDDSNDRTIGLYHDGTASPDWRLGLKNSPSDSGVAPSYAYVYASDGTAGLYANSLNSINLTHGGGFNVINKGNTLFAADSDTGSIVTSFTAAQPVFKVKGATSQAGNLQEWIDSSDSIMARVDADGDIFGKSFTATTENIIAGNKNIITEIQTNSASGVSISGYFQKHLDDSDDHAATAVSGFAAGIVASNTDLIHSSGDFLLREIQANSTSGIAISGFARGYTNEISGVLKQTIDAIPNSLLVSGALAEQIEATSGWAQSTITNSGVAVSGWANGTIITTGIAISGWAGSTITNEIAALVDSAPATLDTLNEIAAAINDDANIATTLTNQITANTTEIRANSASGVAISGWAGSTFGTAADVLANSASGATNITAINASGDFLLNEIRANSASGDYTSSVLYASGVSVGVSGLRINDEGEIRGTAGTITVNPFYNGTTNSKFYFRGVGGNAALNTNGNFFFQRDGDTKATIQSAGFAIGKANDITPASDATYDLGSSSLRWAMLHSSGINIGESGINSDHQLDLIAAGYTFKTKSGSGSDAQITLADGGNTLDIHAYGSNSSPAIRLGGTTPGTSASETMFFTEGGGVTAFKLGDRNRSIQYVFGQGGAASQNDHLIFRAGGGIGWSHETSTVGYPDTLLRRNSSGVLDIYKSDRSAAGSLTYGGLNVGYILTTPPAATDVGHTIKGAAAQSADLAQYQSNAGIVTAKITSDGSIASSGTIEASGNLLTNSTLKANTIEGITALNIYNKSGGGNRIQMGNADTIFYQPMRAVDGIQPNSNNLTTSSLGTETSRWYESHITSGNFYHGIVLSGVPAVTTNALYLDGSTLKFNGSAVGGASDALPHASGDFLLTEIRTNSASGDYTSSILSASGVSVTSSGIRFSHPGNSEYVELAFAGSKFVINSVANGGTARNIALQEDGTDRFYMNAANNAVQVAANLYPSNDASKLLGYTTLRWGVGYFDQLDQEIHTASDVGHVIKGAASQSADLSQWQNNSSTVLASVDNEGSLSIASGHLHIYNPTADGINDTNYERLEIGFDSNTVKIKAAKNGTGSSRVLTLDSHSQVNLKYNNSNRLRVGSSAVTLYTVLSPSSDLNSNIGETSKRFNKGFIHEITASGLNVSGVSLGDHVPVNTTNALYNDGGTLKFNGSAVGGGGGGMSNFILEDGDGTEVTIGDGKEVKFVEGAGIDIDWTDVSDGSDSDPYDLTFTVDHDAASNFVANEHIDHTSVTLTAGDGLTGGGDISSNRTFAVGAGAGITVNANDVAVASGNASGVAFFSGTGGSNLTSSSEFLFDSTDCELFLNQDGSNICFAGSDGDKALKLGNSADSGTNAGKIWLYLNNSTIATMQVGSAGLVQELNNTDDNIQFRDGNNDNVFIIEGGDEAYNTLTTAAGATKIAHVIKGASAQSANLQEWRSNADTTIAHIGSDGSISTSGTLGASGDITGNGGATIAGSLGVGAGDHGSYKVNVNTTSADHTLVINDSNGRIGIKTESLSGDLNIGGSRIVNVVGGNANIRSDDGWLSFRAGGSSNESLSLVGDTVRFAGFDGGAQLNMRTRVTGRRTLVIEKLTSQTADLLNVRDENDDPYFVIDAAGDVDATGLITANSGITLNRVTPASTTDKLYNIAGSLYFNGSAVGGGMSNFILEDGDGTEVTVADGKEIKFVEGAGIDIDWTDVSDGSDSDPYDLTFTVDHDAANNFVANEHIDHTSVTLTAGDGLTGGGDISSNRTFAVGAGDGITVNANDVALATGNPSGVSFFGGDAGLGKLTSISELVIESGQNRIYQFPKGGSAELVKLGWNAAGDTYLINSVANGGTARNIELAVDGDAVLTLNAAQSKIVLAGDLDPDNDASRELGSSTRRFANVYTDQLNAFCHTASDVCVQVKAHASQSANVQSWRTSGGTEFVGIGPDGGIVLPDNTPSSTTNKLYNNGGTLTFNGSAVGGGGGMSNFILEDDSGDEVTISDGKEVKFIGDGVTINWTDTSDGSDADPYDLTFTLDTVSVAKGGTNATSFADKSVIISQDSGTDTLSALALTTNGQLVIGGSSGPAAATLTAGTSISITNADGGITIAYAGGPAPSDEKLKENIKELPNCLEKIDKLSPVSFDWNNLAHEELDKQGSDIGLIAQEVEEIFPEIVGDTQGFKGLDYLKLTVILIKAVQELRQEVENLKSTPN